ncbi:succinate dehydrogenase, cytochrome b556 subunit [Candidatus Erwinia haradaeae]|uniref:Succinate dehydrogenase cytochrome b556 subunit n=1 Tax=Candidatus Erwinia haradaeae TaxID=1922217 RepID=A0A451D3T9_9GAMM|nr:succinate dehydrogenase, cytochrome b556 subunit [Candidatus Erwinia haradaeae]VFP80318.1 Succinate dehydrogenase cytochrome b556 subunit [Candidatus Erwinia haradaeae]
MKKKRPVNLNLSTMYFPLTAIASILHRISGVMIFLSLGVFLWLLGLSLSSPDGFLRVSYILDSYIFKFFIWSILSALSYHISSGIRHMMMDFNLLGVTLQIGKFSAQISFFIAIILSILSGVFVW